MEHRVVFKIFMAGFRIVCQTIFGLVGHGLLGYHFPSFLRKLRSESQEF